MRRCRRGPKPRRSALALLLRTLRRGQSLTSQAARAGVAAPTLRGRFRRTLRWFLRHSRAPAVPAGVLVLLIDALWFRFARGRWTLYLVAAKPTHGAHATFLDPLVVPGRESQATWRRVLRALPATVQGRVRALVSDGFGGAGTLAAEHGWLHQRCHFHLLAQLHARRGTRQRALATRPIREAIYQAVRLALVTADRTQLKGARRTLARLARHPSCPTRFRMFVHDFLRELDRFRAYRNHPDLALPTTTNVVESMGRQLRTRVQTLRSPTALAQWATAFIRLRPPMVCNGWNHQPN